MCALCSKARSAARRAQDEADALKAEAKELKQKADELLQNLRAAEDDVSKLCCSLLIFPLCYCAHQPSKCHISNMLCVWLKSTSMVVMCLPYGCLFWCTLQQQCT